MTLTREILLSAIIVGILALFLSPSHLLMPDTMQAMLMLALVIGFLLFVGVVWREQANDERETVHIHKAGRVSFFVGLGVLVTGVLVQAKAHNVDPWLIYALGAMVLSKLVARVWQHWRG